MLKTIFMCLLVIIMILSSAIADEKAKKETIPMPEGFEGVYIGMLLPDFLKIRPQVRPGGLGPTHETEVDVTKPNQSLGEGVENDQLFGLFMGGMYSFRDGKLRHLSLSWIGWGEKIQDVRKHRGVFISSCIQRWGSDFQKKVLKTEPLKQAPSTDEELLVPVLLWKKGNTMVAVRFSSEYENKALGGGFTLTLFSQDDKEIMTIFAGEKVDDSVRDKLFEKIGVIP